MAGCFEFLHISNEFPGHFKFAALDYTGPHPPDFNEITADFLGYGMCRDGVRDFYCITSPFGLPIVGGPQPAIPPHGLLCLPGLRTRLVGDIRRALCLAVGNREVLVWFVGGRLRLVVDPQTGNGDIDIPFDRGVPIIVELMIEPTRVLHQVTEYQTNPVAQAAA